MNFDKLRLVADRAGSGEKEEAMLTSIMKEQKGEFRKFVNILSDAGVCRWSRGCVWGVCVRVCVWCVCLKSEIQ